MKKYTGRQIRCGIGTDDQEWLNADDVYEFLKEEIHRSGATIQILEEFKKQTGHSDAKDKRYED